MSKQKIGVKCPVCKKPFYYYESEFRPFCSQRCKFIDLGHWIAEDYTVGSSDPLSEVDMEEVIRHHTEGEEYEQ